MQVEKEHALKNKTEEQLQDKMSAYFQSYVAYLDGSQQMREEELDTSRPPPSLLRCIPGRPVFLDMTTYVNNIYSLLRATPRLLAELVSSFSFESQKRQS